MIQRMAGWQVSGGVAMAFALLACGSSGSKSGGAPGAELDASAAADASTALDGGKGDASLRADAGACQRCSKDADCQSARCVQLVTGSTCMPACASDGACAAGEQCVQVPDVAGSRSAVCVASSAGCGGPEPIGDAGAQDPSQVCGHLVGPTLVAPCGSSCAGTGASRCQNNGCEGGQWCDTDTNQCTAAPSSSNQCGNDGPGAPYDAGAGPTGSVGADGGTVSRLYFAVVGDTRPPGEDDTSGYPTAIITRIFADVQALDPRPTFGISTGDYMFASPTGTESATQLDLYLGARAGYSGLMFPTMGNHECTGATASNCGAGLYSGITTNYTNFLTKLLAPLGQSSPNYEIDIGATDGTWTSKFLFVAGNAFSNADATWFDQALSRKTTYTFIVRHEAASANTAPGVNTTEAIMAKHPYTLAIVGHDHIYRRSGAREVTIGNGGAPPTGVSGYGFGVINQRADGALAVDVLDYMTGLADTTFHFAVNADGSNASP